MTYLSLKGFRDILPDESRRLDLIESRLRSVADRYGFGEIRLPMMEQTALFARGVGEETDVVGKEMYSFLDKSEPPESVTLRPELTAGAVRAWIEGKIGKAQNLTRWYYLGPAFRYEQPQAGRYRQFSTFGIELIGADRPESDAEVIAMGRDIIGSLGITRYRTVINTLGTPEERTRYREALVGFLEGRAGDLSEESRRRLETNPLRVLDSKDDGDRAAVAGAPTIDEFLEEESRDHFARLCDLLDRAEVTYERDPHLVRGLDYYSRTVFEFLGDDLGAQNALGGGGRYDTLVETLGGDPTPAIGFGFGIERLMIASEKTLEVPESHPDLYIVALDDDARAWTVGMAATLRGRSLSVMTDLLGRSMKAQMREANRTGAARVLIVGSSEIATRTAQLKEMESGEQKEVAFDDLVAVLTGAAS